jgi:hypothetical protein
VITEERELKLWKEEWRAEVGAPPALKKRVSLQTLRMIASNVLGGLIAVFVLVASLKYALRHPSPQVIVWAVANWVSLLISAVFVVWNQIGIWQPEVQSTRGYAELLYKRASSKIRKIRFLFIAFYGAAAFDLAYLAWTTWLGRARASAHPAELLARSVRLFSVLLGVWLFLLWYNRRKTQQLEEAKAFLKEVEAGD